MGEDAKYHRRHFLSSAAMTFAAAKLTMLSSDAKPIDLAESTQTKAQTNTSFGVLKQIDAGVLNVGYAEAGPPDGSLVILLHGWPYDIYSYVPTITMEGDANGAPHPDANSYAKKFSGKYTHGLIKGASATICRRKRQRSLPKLCSKLMVIDER